MSVALLVLVACAWSVLVRVLVLVLVLTCLVLVSSFCLPCLLAAPSFFFLPFELTALLGVFLTFFLPLLPVLCWTAVSNSADSFRWPIRLKNIP